MIAAWGGHSSIVTELIGAGAQIDAQDQVAACVCVLNFGFLVTRACQDYVPHWKHPNIPSIKLQKSIIYDCATKSRIIMSIYNHNINN